MQPTQRFKKPLLASALVFGTGITFNASADLFTVTAEAIPDVAVSIAVGTQISFGTGVIGNKTGFTCALAGISHVDEDDLLFDPAGDLGNNANTGKLVTESPITGDACISGSTGEILVIEIDGADASTVSVSVPDVTGAAGWVYTPTAQSCVVNFDRATDSTQDVCQPLGSNTVSGIGMSNTQADGITTATDEIPDTAVGYSAMSGKTRMVLAGELELTADLGDDFSESQSILVQVTYE